MCHCGHSQPYVKTPVESTWFCSAAYAGRFAVTVVSDAPMPALPPAADDMVIAPFFKRRGHPISQIVRIGIGEHSRAQLFQIEAAWDTIGMVVRRARPGTVQRQSR